MPLRSMKQRVTHELVKTLIVPTAWESHRRGKRTGNEGAISFSGRRHPFTWNTERHFPPRCTLVHLNWLSWFSNRAESEWNFALRPHTLHERRDRSNRLAPYFVNSVRFVDCFDGDRCCRPSVAPFFHLSRRSIILSCLARCRARKKKKKRKRRAVINERVCWKVIYVREASAVRGITSRQSRCATTLINGTL